MQKNKIRGFSLIELMVVLSIFVMLGILVTQGLFLTFKSSIKTETQIKVRENVNYALGIMARHLHNAKSLNSCTNTNLNYSDQYGQSADFQCNTTDGYIASSGARLTNTEVLVTACNFTCTSAGPGTPTQIKITVTAKDIIQSAEISAIDISTTVVMRSY